MRRPRVQGRYRPPGDKSLSHRALLLAALAGGETELADLNSGVDVETTAACLRELGVTVERRGRHWIVRGGGVTSFRRPTRAIDCGNSGTTMRLLAGVLAACPFESTLTGDDSLSARPMGRIAEPLTKMGARVGGRRRGGQVLPPLRIRGAGLRAIRYRQVVSSAQVKSSILLAAWAAGVTAEVVESPRSRDHTERMLKALGEDVRRIRGGVRLVPGGAIRPPRGTVPGDPSAGAFFAAAAAALPGSELTLEGVCLNPTRLGFFRAISRMGARVETVPRERWCGEPVGELRVRAGRLSGIRLGRSSVPSLVDEVPLLAVLGAGAARGTTSISGAEELRVKESDRIAAMAAGLATLGARVVERPGGLLVKGGRLHGGTVESCGDHRVAMAFRIAGTLADEPVRVRGASAMNVSHPGFDRTLRMLLGRAA